MKYIKIMKKIFALILCCFLILPKTLSANPYSVGKVFSIKEGQKAPFSGTLMDNNAVAKIIAEQDSQKEQCSIEKERELSLQKAKNDLETSNIKASKEATEERSKEIINLKNEQIKFLQNQAINVSKKEKNMSAILAGSIAGGVVAGVLLTIAAAFVLKEASK